MESASAAKMPPATAAFGRLGALAPRQMSLTAVALVGIVVLAFALRLGARLLDGEERFWANSYSLFYEIALNFTRGEGLCIQRLGWKCAHRPPVYPLVLAATTLFGGSYLPIVILQAAIGAGTALCAFLIGRLLFSPLAGLLAAALVALYPYYVVHDTALQETGLFTFLTALAILFLLRARAADSTVAALLGGLCLGLAVLTRATLAPFALLAGLWLALFGAPRLPRRLALALAALAPLGLLVGLWLLRTYLLVGAPLLTSQAGRLLWVGNNEHTFDFYPTGSIDRSAAAAWSSLASAERSAVLQLGEAEQSAWFARRGFAYLLADPGRTLQGAARKLEAAFSWRLSPAREPLVQAIYALAYVPILALGVVGGLLAWRDWRAHSLLYLLLASFLGVTVVYWAHTSHRSFLDLYLMVFAAYAVSRVGVLLAGQRKGLVKQEQPPAASARGKGDPATKHPHPELVEGPDPLPRGEGVSPHPDPLPKEEGSKPHPPSPRGRVRVRLLLAPRRAPVLLALLAVVLLVVGHRVWLQGVGNLLLLREEPVPADAVVVLAGDSRGGRAFKGAELVRDGYAPRLYVLDDSSCVRGYCLRWSELWRANNRRPMLNDFQRLIPREAVVPLLDDQPLAAGTHEEAAAAWQRLEPLGVRRILLVTDEFHSRRAALAWRKVVGGRAEIVSVPCTTTTSCVSVDRWWEDREAVKTVWLEYLRLAGYALLGHLW